MQRRAPALFALASSLFACSPDAAPAPPDGSLNAGAGKPAAAGIAAPGAGNSAGRSGVPTAGVSGMTGIGQAGALAGAAGKAGGPSGGVAGTQLPPGAGRAGAPPRAAGTGGMSAAAGSGGALTPVTATGDRATVEGVCARWKGDRADVSEGTWTGNVADCNAGDMAPQARANALRVLNLYRWLADLPAVTSDPTMDKQAQSCALLQRANNMLSHTPPTTWACYMEEGAKAAGKCNISSGPAVSSVDGYMVDPGNDTTIGHRRWILSNTFGPTGIGGTDKHSCLMTMGNMKVGKPWMAWPSPGVIPLQALQQGFGQWVQKVDMTGWSLQSDTINLGAATVTVTSDGMPMPVTVTQLMPYYGSRYALRFNPMGWSATAGKTYKVVVGGIPQPIEYDVQIANCK